jgi:hypothetical protein
METTFKKVQGGLGDAKIGTSLSFGGGKENIEAVQLTLQSSTATARVMNLAMKMLALDWQEDVLDHVEEMVDNRLLEIVNGKDYKVEVLYTRVGDKENYQRIDRFWVRAMNPDRARQIVDEKTARHYRTWSNYKITKVFLLEARVDEKLVEIEVEN